jgi:CheY-like chemotaxis protein
MLVRCPQCRSEFRLTGYGPAERVVKYLCPGCRTIVRIDLTMDEVRSSSSSGSYRSLERRRTVLVAEDNVRILGVAERLLSEAGYNVLVASDGVEALRVLREEHPDLLVLDLLMPGLTGFDVLREARQDERIKDTPVLAMSGVYRDNVLAFLEQLGARGFLDTEKLEETLVRRVQEILPGAGGS